MPCRRLWLLAFGWIILSTVVQAKEYQLREPLQKDDCHEVQLEMSLQGDLHFTHEGESKSVPIHANAAHTFTERLLLVEETGLPRKAARFYQSAKSTVKVKSSTTDKTLRPKCCLMVVQEMPQGLMAYCPKALLYRAELELTEHLSTLHLSGLLPDKAVKINESWKILPRVVQALCQFDGLIDQKWKCTLRKVEDGQASVSFRGKAKGVEDGALVEVEVSGGYHFDLNEKRITSLQWQQKDKREGGPVSPNLTARVSVTLTRKKVDVPQSLSDSALKAVPDDLTIPEGKDLLEHQDARERYRLNYRRGWHVVSLQESHLVLRLIQQGEMIAQLSVVPWSPIAQGEKHQSPDEFKKLIRTSPGWDPQKELSAGPVSLSDKYWIYQLTERGLLQGLEVIQRAYLVASFGKGKQYVLAFVMVPKQEKAFGKIDEKMIREFEILK